MSKTQSGLWCPPHVDEHQTPKWEIYVFIEFGHFHCYSRLAKRWI